MLTEKDIEWIGPGVSPPSASAGWPLEAMDRICVLCQGEEGAERGGYGDDLFAFTMWVRLPPSVRDPAKRLARFNFVLGLTEYEMNASDEQLGGLLRERCESAKSCLRNFLVVQGFLVEQETDA